MILNKKNISAYTVISLLILMCFYVNSCKKEADSKAPITIPTVITSNVSNITKTTAVCGGIVTNDGGGTVTSRGVSWNTSINPYDVTGEASLTKDGAGVGSFTSNISNLKTNRNYYIRAYARNEAGVGYGEIIPFISDCILFNPDLEYGTLTDIDGNEYKTIQIGTQIWMAENLRVSRYRNGVSIPYITVFGPNFSTDLWCSLTTGAYTGYNSHTSSYVSLVGSMYNWYAVNNPNNIAPQGWHVSTVEDWAILINYLGGDSAIAKLQESEQWTCNTNTNSSGFSARPTGYLASQTYNDGFAYWWTTSEYDSLKAWNHYIGCNYDWYTFNPVNKNWGIFVRCVKD